MEPIDIELEEGELELPAEPMHLNMGPSHPAMHGTVRMVLELSGETIVKLDMQVGYLHRGFEKMCERGTWAQVFPYVDRLNYVSPMLNNVGYALAVEKICEIAVPERCQWYRMALGELARISDHLTCDGAMAMELGAFTPFLWFVKAREMVWDILEEETGARLTHSFGRIGGMAQPPTADFKGLCRAALPQIPRLVEEGEALLLKNRIFLDRRRICGSAARQRPLKSAVGGWAMPPMRPNECVRRAPVSSSRMSHTISRALTNQRNGVKAPSSIAIAPSHVRWSLMRASSPSAMRYHWHRSGTAISQIFST